MKITPASKQEQAFYRQLGKLINLKWYSLGQKRSAVLRLKALLSQIEIELVTPKMTEKEEEKWFLDYFKSFHRKPKTADMVEHLQSLSIWGAKVKVK